MRSTLQRFSPGVEFALLTVVAFFAGSSSYAQAQTRPFLMGLWTDPSHANSDIAVFSPGQHNRLRAPESEGALLCQFSQQ